MIRCSTDDTNNHHSFRDFDMVRYLIVDLFNHTLLQRVEKLQEGS